MIKRFWFSYYGYWLCKLLGHSKLIQFNYDVLHDKSYSGCARCKANIGA